MPVNFPGGNQSRNRKIVLSIYVFPSSPVLPSGDQPQVIAVRHDLQPTAKYDTLGACKERINKAEDNVNRIINLRGSPQIIPEI